MTRIGPNSLSDGGGHIQRFRQNNQQVSQSLERLSTGKRINRPRDDPSGFIAAEGLRGDLIELRAQSRAASSNRFVVRQRESALGQIQKTLTNVRGNLVTVADGLNSSAQSRAIQQEIDTSLDAIDQIAARVEGVSDSTPLRELREGGSANVIDGDIQAASELVDNKLSELSRSRAAAGAYERTEEIFEQLRQDQIVITTETLSQIEDTDFAAETSNLVQGQILSQASIAALAFSQREQIEQLEALFDSLDEE